MVVGSRVAAVSLATAAVLGFGACSSTTTAPAGPADGAQPARSAALQPEDTSPAPLPAAPPPADILSADRSVSGSPVPMGPLAAAIAVAELRQDLVALPAEDAVAALTAVAHPDAAGDLISGLRVDLARRDEIAPAGLIARVAVIETRVVSASTAEASIELWTATVVTGAGNARVTYQTLVYDMALLDRRWLLVDESAIDGPVPTPIQEPSDPAALEAALVGFSDPQLLAGP